MSDSERIQVKFHQLDRKTIPRGDNKNNVRYKHK